MQEIQQRLDRWANFFLRKTLGREYTVAQPKAEQIDQDQLNKPEEPQPKNKLGSIKVRKELENLGSLITHGFFHDVKIPLLSSDLILSPTLNRLLPEIPTSYVWLSLEENRFWLQDSYLETPNALLKILIPIKNLDKIPEITGLMIRSGRIRQKGVYPPQFYSHYDFFELSTDEDHHYTKGREILPQKDLRPIDLIEELKEIIRGLRVEFIKHHQQEAANLLDPTQRGLVRAIQERCLAICQTSVLRKHADEFLILGTPGLTDQLSGLTVLASIASERQAGEFWFDERIFDEIAVDTGDAQVQSTHFLGFGSRGYRAGEISLESLHQGDRTVLERVPLMLSADSDMGLNGLIGDFFQYFVYQRANQDYQEGIFKAEKEKGRQDDSFDKIFTDFRSAVILDSSKLFKFN